ncbi:MAG: DNA sulfur modification protein DndE [Candidatus Odinarchaeia archaeon]
MSFNRVRISEEATQRLSLLKRRTGLTPNILCRIAFCLSLKEPGLPETNQDSQGQEFNRYTLTGEWDSFYMALLKIRLMNDGLDPDMDQLARFKEHVERGVILLYNRVKEFPDLATLT